MLYYLIRDGVSWLGFRVKVATIEDLAPYFNALYFLILVTFGETIPMNVFFFYYACIDFVFERFISYFTIKATNVFSSERFHCF